MPVEVGDDSTMAEQMRPRKPRNLETDPNSSRSKTTISSILNTSGPSNDPSTSKKKNFTTATFRGLGCTASAQVSVPAVIRTSANWEAKKLKKKRLKTKKGSNDKLLIANNSATSCVGGPNVWCGPGMGLTNDAASVDCVVSRRPARGKVDGLDRILLGQRERSYVVRRMVSAEDNNPFLESDTAVGITRIRSDFAGSRHSHHVRHGFHDGLAEIVMLQSSMLMGGRLDGLDRYGDLRLDIDNMSYEELLELGDRIGYVNTGLGDDEISRCVRRTKLATLDDLSLHFASNMERNCSICQEEYEPNDEMGKLKCGHFYHIHCIKQWLGHKNSCPICKTSAISQTEAK